MSTYRTLCGKNVSMFMYVCVYTNMMYMDNMCSKTVRVFRHTYMSCMSMPYCGGDVYCWFTEWR